MLSTNLEKLHNTFNESVNIDAESNVEFWYARELRSLGDGAILSLFTGR